MLLWTEDFSKLEECQHILVHLNEETWTRGQDSDAFAHEVCDAMRAGVHRLLVHEVRGARIDDEARLGCTFEHLIATTRDYLKKPGRLYTTEIAMNLLGGEWRECGLVMLLREIAKGARGSVVEEWLPHKVAATCLGADSKKLPHVGTVEQHPSKPVAPKAALQFRLSDHHGNEKLCARSLARAVMRHTHHMMCMQHIASV